MLGLSDSELLFYGGLVIMAATALLSVFGIVFFSITGRKLKRKLELEYGKTKR